MFWRRHRACLGGTSAFESDLNTLSMLEAGWKLTLSLQLSDLALELCLWIVSSGCRLQKLPPTPSILLHRLSLPNLFAALPVLYPILSDRDTGQGHARAPSSALSPAAACLRMISVEPGQSEDQSSRNASTGLLDFLAIFVQAVQAVTTKSDPSEAVS